MCGAQVAVPVAEVTATLGPGFQPNSGPQANSGPQPTSSPFQGPGMYPPYYQQPSSSYPMRQETEPFAIVSFVCSMVGIVFCVGAILGIVFGHIAMSKIKASGERLGGKGFAMAGLIVGYIWIGMMLFWITGYIFFVVTVATTMMDTVHAQIERDLQEQRETRPKELMAPEMLPVFKADEDTHEASHEKDQLENPFEVIDESVSKLPKFDSITPHEEEPSPPDSEEAP